MKWSSLRKKAALATVLATLCVGLVGTATSYAGTSRGDLFRLNSTNSTDPCDPCGPVACGTPCDEVKACDPCEPVACGPCDAVEDDLSCNISCDTQDTCKPDPCDKISKAKAANRQNGLSVYGSVAGLVGNFDGGFMNIDGKQAGFTLSGGLKATAGVQHGKNALEIGYSWLSNGESTTFVSNPVQLTPPFASAIHAQADFYNIDVNFVRTLDRFPNVQAFGGVGYVNFTQKADVTTLGTVRNFSFSNDLVGLHVGGKWSRSLRAFGLETYSKIGVYANNLSHHASDANGASPINWSGNCRGAWTGAGGMSVTYKLSRCMTGFIGYDVTMVEGVERGGGISKAVGNGGVTHPAFNRASVSDDRVMIQGVTFGLKGRF